MQVIRGLTRCMLWTHQDNGTTVSRWTLAGMLQEITVKSGCGVGEIRQEAAFHAAWARQ